MGQSQEAGAPDIRALAKEAYIYGFPLVDSYRIQHAYFVNPKSPEYKGPWNQIVNISRVFTPADKAVQTPNSDTPYSMLGLNLTAEPLVLTVPMIEKGRYFSIQLVDAYTHNFAYIGSRTTGNDGGQFLIAGPGWTGRAPRGMKVIRSETNIVLGIYRTQLFQPADLDNVKKVQEGYRVQPLSAVLGQSAPAAAEVTFVPPLSAAAQKTSLEFYQILNAVLAHCPTVRSERKLMERFALIGVGAGKAFDPEKLSPETRAAMTQGMADAWAELALLQKQIDAGKLSSGDLFGTRQHLKNNYLYRMAGAVLGIFGNSQEEAMYPTYTVDSAGEKLNGSQRYTLHFAPGEFPPAKAFWSLTMYELPSSLLVANPINRYLLNSPMMSQFKLDADGGLTLSIQNESPGADLETNWLPAPKGPFMLVMRLYWPGSDALKGKWTHPPLRKAE